MTEITKPENESPPCSACAARFREIQQERDELQATFDLHWKAERRGLEMWREATGKLLILPDTASLTVWLIERLDRAEAKLK